MIQKKDENNNSLTENSAYLKGKNNSITDSNLKRKLFCSLSNPLLIFKKKLRKKNFWRVLRKKRWQKLAKPMRKKLEEMKKFKI